jgi:hypothetical protein
MSVSTRNSQFSHSPEPHFGSDTKRHLQDQNDRNPLVQAAYPGSRIANPPVTR